jgi:hypothetical protein
MERLGFTMDCTNVKLLSLRNFMSGCCHQTTPVVVTLPQVANPRPVIVLAAKEAAKERLEDGRKKGGQTAGRGRQKDSDSSRETLPESNGRARDEPGKAVGGYA